MSKKQHYLDYNATAPLRPEARTALLSALDVCGNASSIHAAGRAARALVESARAQIAVPLDVDAKQIIFTSGATEANNCIVRGFAGRRLVSAVEHPSVFDADGGLEIISVTENGVVDLPAFEKQISTGPAPSLVSVMLIQNETGVIQPVADIAAIAKKYGAVAHCDAVQAYGRYAFTRAELNVDFLSLSAHKIGGPQGVGVLVMAPGAPTPRLLRGGGQERMQRAGTENVAGIAGFGAAAEVACTQYDAFSALSVLRDRAEKFVRASSPRVKIFGDAVPRIANTLCFAVQGVSAETMLMALDLDGVCVSSGAACSSGTVKPSRTLKAMGANDALASGALRLSLGYASTPDDIAAFEAAWTKLIARIG